MVPALVATGGLFGAGYVAASAIVPLPRLLTGGICGLALWWGNECVYRAMPDRQLRWSASPRARLKRFVAFGATVALVTELGQLERQ